MNKQLFALAIGAMIVQASYGMNIAQLKNYLPEVVKDIKKLEPALGKLVNGDIGEVRAQLKEIDLKKTLANAQTYVAIIKNNIPEMLKIIQSAPETLNSPSTAALGLSVLVEPAAEYLENNQDIWDSINSKLAFIKSQASNENIMKGLALVEQNFSKIQDRAQLKNLFVTKVQTPLKTIDVNALNKSVDTMAQGIAKFQETGNFALKTIVATVTTFRNLSKVITAIGGVASITLEMSEQMKVPFPAQVKEAMTTVSDAANRITDSMNDIQSLTKLIGSFGK